MGLKKLFVDIPALLESNADPGKIECEYLFHRHNKGQFSVLEAAEFAVYCRQCEDAFCVMACPKEALERLENGMIKRYNMRCVGCKSCVLVCPFGTIFPEVINYVTSNCDYCLNQLNDDESYLPSCVKTAPVNTFAMKEVEKEEPDKNIFFCGEHMAVKNHNWKLRR
jgi:Fe-S-cluster-containing dehydrogenase component